jgi:hypothetical protein
MEQTLVKKTIKLRAPLDVWVYCEQELEVPADMTEEQITELAIQNYRDCEVDFELDDDDLMPWGRIEVAEDGITLESIEGDGVIEEKVSN